VTVPIDAPQPDGFRIPPAALRTIVEGYTLPLMGIHGLPHWARVLENGRRLATETGADRVVVELFAVFHDARRVSEGGDRNHGRRGSELARQLTDVLPLVSDTQLTLLCEACEGHTSGLTHPDPTVGTCWDADRLDLWRVGIEVEPRLLSSAAARERGVLAWARERSIGEVVLPIVGEWMAAVGT
jgi:uncharacterized protein